MLFRNLTLKSFLLYSLDLIINANKAFIAGKDYPEAIKTMEELAKLGVVKVLETMVGMLLMIVVRNGRIWVVMANLILR